MLADAVALLQRADGGLHRDAQDQNQAAKGKDQDDAEHAEGLDLARAADDLGLAEALDERVICRDSFEHAAFAEVLGAHGKFQCALLEPGEARLEPFGKFNDPLIVRDGALDVLKDRLRGCSIN